MNPVPALVTTAKIPRLVELYATSFVDDPMIRWPLPADAGLVECKAMFQVLLAPYIDLQVVWQVADCSGSAAWLDPASAARFGEIDRAMREHVAPLTDDDGARYGQFWDWLGSHVPSEPCWVLDMVAVDPAHRGAGLGRLLIEHGLAMARADGLPAFLETSQERNVGYYERLGFEVLSREQSPGGGPEIWFMRHP